ncbi:MAG: hypothetical protein H0V96_09370 [Acidimicrobiia bacterium]|nr:hypothetical protein [Acidimicrobiia bacterium]
MEKTGESYTAARAMLLAAAPSPDTPAPPLATSDATIRARTGRGWEEWFDMLDEYGAAERSHREVARWVADQLGIEPLVWEAQAVTVSYERARGLRAVGEHPDGFTITASRTVQVPAERLFDAVTNEERRKQWLPEGDLRQRTVTPSRSARYDWNGGDSRVAVYFDAKGPAKSTVVVEHARLADADEAEQTKLFWRDRLTALKAQLEGGEIDA